MDKSLLRQIKKQVANAVTAAFTFKQPRKTAFEYCNKDYVITVQRENFSKTNVKIETLNFEGKNYVCAQNDVQTDYAPQFVVNALKMMYHETI